MKPLEDLEHLYLIQPPNLLKKFDAIFKGRGNPSQKFPQMKRIFDNSGQFVSDKEKAQALAMLCATALEAGNCFELIRYTEAIFTLRGVEPNFYDAAYAFISWAIAVSKLPGRENEKNRLLAFVNSTRTAHNILESIARLSALTQIGTERDRPQIVAMAGKLFSSRDPNGAMQALISSLTLLRQDMLYGRVDPVTLDQSSSSPEPAIIMANGFFDPCFPRQKGKVGKEDNLALIVLLGSCGLYDLQQIAVRLSGNDSRLNTYLKLLELFRSDITDSNQFRAFVTSYTRGAMKELPPALSPEVSVLLAQCSEKELRYRASLSLPQGPGTIDLPAFLAIEQAPLSLCMTEIEEKLLNRISALIARAYYFYAIGSMDIDGVNMSTTILYAFPGRKLDIYIETSSGGLLHLSYPLLQFGAAADQPLPLGKRYLACHSLLAALGAEFKRDPVLSTLCPSLSANLQRATRQAETAFELQRNADSSVRIMEMALDGIALNALRGEIALSENALVGNLSLPPEVTFTLGKGDRLSPAITAVEVFPPTEIPDQIRGIFGETVTLLAGYQVRSSSGTFIFAITTDGHEVIVPGISDDDLDFAAALLLKHLALDLLSRGPWRDFLAANRRVFRQLQTTLQATPAAKDPSIGFELSVRYTLVRTILELLIGQLARRTYTLTTEDLLQQGSPSMVRQVEIIPPGEINAWLKTLCPAAPDVVPMPPSSNHLPFGVFFIRGGEDGGEERLAALVTGPDQITFLGSPPSERTTRLFLLELALEAVAVMFGPKYKPASTPHSLSIPDRGRKKGKEDRVSRWKSILARTFLARIRDHGLQGEIWFYQENGVYRRFEDQRPEAKIIYQKEYGTTAIFVTPYPYGIPTTLSVRELWVEGAKATAACQPSALKSSQIIALGTETRKYTGVYLIITYANGKKRHVRLDSEETIPGSFERMDAVAKNAHQLSPASSETLNWLLILFPTEHQRWQVIIDRLSSVGKILHQSIEVFEVDQTLRVNFSSLEKLTRLR